jgi:phosphohistidine phosphatase SixA
MKKIIIIRHGLYSGEDLNEAGKMQMQKLASTLSWVNPSTTAMLSSSAPRASQSAKILSESLLLSFSEHEILWSDNQHDYNVAKAFELIRAQIAETVIVVTHLEYTEELPWFLCEKILGSAGIMKGYRDLYKGEMVVIDLENKVWEKFNG